MYHKFWIIFFLLFGLLLWHSCSDGLGTPSSQKEFLPDVALWELTIQEKTTAPEPDQNPDEPDGPEVSVADITDAYTIPEEPFFPELTQEVTPEPEQPPIPSFQPGVFQHTVSGRTLYVFVLSPTLLRIRYVRGQQPHPDRGWTHILTSWPTATYPTTDNPDIFSLQTSALIVQIRKSDATVVIRTVDGQVLSEDLPPTGQNDAQILRKRIESNEVFYGFGEKTGPLNKRGFRLTMWNTDPLYPTNQYTPTADPIYQSIPFFIGLRNKQAYGVYLNNTFRTTFDVGHAAIDQLRMEITGGEMDYFFTYGPSMRRVVEQFTQITGRFRLPPLWTLGYHQSRWSYAPASEVQRIASEFRTRQIPCDGLWLDIDYMDGFRSFTWSPTGFPQPADLLSQLQKSGFKVTAILDPGIKEDPGGNYKVYNTGMTNKHFVLMPDQTPYVGVVWPGNSLFPDFSNPSTRQWWGQFVKDFLASGLQGLWIDMNEPATWQPTGFPLDSVFAGEGTRTDHRETHNVYALLMAQATYEGMLSARPQQRPFVLTRAGFAGIQRYAAVWTGDMASSWEHLRMAPAMMMNMGLSGIPMIGSDIGGFTGGPAPELFARWMQLGSISPFFRAHVQTGSARQEPWSFGQNVEQISQAAIVWRYRMLPYFYSLMWEAGNTGIPPLRPLVFHNQQDEQTYQRNDVLMLGEFLLVAPVVESGQNARMFYLPQGVWFDYHSSHAFEGGGEISVAAPLERLPLLVRQGAILPSWRPTQFVGEKAHTTLFVDLYPVAGIPATQFVWYQDDGQSTQYQAGQFAKRTLQLTTIATGATLDVGATEGSFAASETHLYLRWHGVKVAPTSCTLDNKPLSAQTALATLETTDGWFYEATTETIHARVPVTTKAAQVQCSYDATRPLVQKVQVEFTVQLPANTPTGDIYLASNLFGWQPNGRLMKRTGNTATLTLNLQQGMAFAYKYTQGQWTQVEKLPTCKERDNRFLVVTTAPQQTVADTVDAWAHVGCP